MSRRTGHVTTAGLLTADGLVKTGAGRLFCLTIAWRGWTAGEFCTIKDGATAAGTDEVMIVFPTANGTLQLAWEDGKAFATGLYFNKGATAAGSVWAEVVYQ